MHFSIAKFRVRFRVDVKYFSHALSSFLQGVRYLDTRVRLFVAIHQEVGKTQETSMILTHYCDTEKKLC